MEEAKEIDLNESIYNLLHRTQCPLQPPKQPRYKSVFRELAKTQLNNGKHERRTFGSATPAAPHPADFLKKNQSSTRLCELTCQRRSARPPPVDLPRKPCVPKCYDSPVVNERTKKDFICLNATHVCLSKARKPSLKNVDTRKGDSFALEGSGMNGVHVQKKNYGKVPRYLERRKECDQKAQEEYEEYLQQRLTQGSLQQIPDDERERLLDGLKKNWEELHLMYQKMSIFIDTFGKKRRKLYIESEMKQIERDIALLEGHPQVFILT